MNELEQRAMEIAEDVLRRRIAPPNEVIADPSVQRSASETCIVHFRHHYRGVPLFLTATSVHVDDDGNVQEVLGPADDAAIEFADVTPTIAPREALRAAIDHLAGDGCAEHEPIALPKRRHSHRTLAAFPLPSRPTVFNAGPFADPVTVELTIHERALMWLVTIMTRDRDEHLVLVRANGDDAKAIAFCSNITPRACRASIFLFDPDTARATVDFPLAIARYPLPFHANAAAVPFRWMDRDETFGNNAETFWNQAKRRIKAAKSGNDFIFANAGTTSLEQCVLNAFFFCNFAHDFFGLLGFSEKDGAFHEKNSSGLGAPGDRLRLFLTDLPVDGLGSMNAANDGKNPQMDLGRDATTGRHAALEGCVVIHEYTHGVTTRLIGGTKAKDALVAKQSRALGEAWSDFFSLTIQNYYRRESGAADVFAFGRWCTSDGGGRSRPYDASYNVNFGAVGRAGHDKPHTAGEVWAAAAIDYARRITVNDWREGYVIAWRTMFESLRNVPINPTFLEARTALFKAIEKLGVGNDVLAAARESFRRRGMGFHAQCAKNPAILDQNSEDFTPWP